MAYRSFGADFFEADAQDQAAIPNAPAVPLGPSDSMAVALGMREGLSSLHGDAWPARLARALFGIGPKRPLADPRLESLRRLAVRLRHRPKRASAEIATALSEGVTAAQIAAIVERVGAGRRRRLEA